SAPRPTILGGLGAQPVFGEASLRMTFGSQLYELTPSVGLALTGSATLLGEGVFWKRPASFRSVRPGLEITLLGVAVKKEQSLAASTWAFEPCPKIVTAGGFGCPPIDAFEPLNEAQIFNSVEFTSEAKTCAYRERSVKQARTFDETCHATEQGMAEIECRLLVRFLL